MSDRFEAEIRLAERGVHVLMERIALKRMPADAQPLGHVYDLLNAAGEQLELQALESQGKKVPKRRFKKVARSLVAAIDRLTEWPEEPRLRVASALVETLRGVQLESVAANLLVALQMADSRHLREQATSADSDIDPRDHARQLIDAGEWSPELQDVLRELRELSAGDPEDSELRDLLDRGIVFNAVAGREHLLLEERRRLAEAEPLPEELATAFESLPADIAGSELLRLGLHLVLADVVAAGLVPKKTPPDVAVAATLVALLRRDVPGKKPDVDRLGAWARTNPLKLDVLSDEIAPVFEWMPPEHRGSAEERHLIRWRVQSLMYQYLPLRWMAAPRDELPPYSRSEAQRRAEDLRDVAWMMIDEIEPVRFVSEAFRYGDGAPEAMDIDIVHEVIELWQEQALVRATDELGRSYLEDEWHHEIPDDGADGDSEIQPAPLIVDGEPLVLCTVVFSVAEGARDEIAEHLDGTETFRREISGGDRWMWLGPSARSKQNVAELLLETDYLTVETWSLARASRVNARLVEELGERIVLKDIRTQQPTPEMLAELGIEAAASGEDSGARPDDQVQVVHQVLERHYRRWIDEALPALGDLSPRTVAADPLRRPDVAALLIEAEERTRASSWPMSAFEFDFLWEELGLDRDEAE